MSSEEESNPYELLSLTLEATEQEIKTAYRQRSLKVHPDRNRGNPDAARKFHELHQAQELLLDPLRRMALDAKMRQKQARQARFATYDAKRKGLVEELEERERVLKKARVEKEAEKRERWRENERIMDEGRRLREEREKALQQREAEREAEERAADGLEPPSLGVLDTTVRVKYTLAAYPALTEASSLVPLLSSFGDIDESSIVLSLKPAPPKKPKRVIALVPFKQIGGAFAAVCRKKGMEGIEIDWAEGKEPDLIGWLKKMGQLRDDLNTVRMDSKASASPASASPPSNSAKSPPGTSKDKFSSFPSTFPDPNSVPPATNVPTAAGLDYESLTLMRMRQAERAKLEREIREREEAEG
ncbi:DnaJ-domain-containing protein [Epithele typhae]|uniref:DnaJ-domain-containing protein n=1 Tax=Epithele typhae TaxID=378194 RepID=UPI0020072A74|nr:DnaJ-domain-containing protein [Epithele typhae]KAH9940038.1 DnaJ-domain-containing protein [Epithele typhae]